MKRAPGPEGDTRFTAQTGERDITPVQPHKAESGAARTSPKRIDETVCINNQEREMAPLPPTPPSVRTRRRQPAPPAHPLGPTATAGGPAAGEHDGGGGGRAGGMRGPARRAARALLGAGLALAVGAAGPGARRLLDESAPRPAGCWPLRPRAGTRAGEHVLLSASVSDLL